MHYFDCVLHKFCNPKKFPQWIWTLLPFKKTALQAFSYFSKGSHVLSAGRSSLYEWNTAWVGEIIASAAVWWFCSQCICKFFSDMPEKASRRWKAGRRKRSRTGACVLLRCWQSVTLSGIGARHGPFAENRQREAGSVLGSEWSWVSGWGDHGSNRVFRR